MNDFTYLEDKVFFIELLAHGDEALFETKFARLFDFRDPQIKRKEFNAIRNAVYAKLIARYGPVCQLKVHPDCTKDKQFHVDHMIPLSSVILQRKLRGMKNNPDGTKPKSLSYGSNHPDNLLLACARCNSFKKHRLFSKI